MSIPIKSRTGDVFTAADNLMIGEVVVSPTYKRVGIGVGGVQPRWYPGLDKNNNLIMSYGTKFIMENSDTRRPSTFGFENDDFVVRVNGTVVLKVGSLGVVTYGIFRNGQTPSSYLSDNSGLNELLFPQYAGKGLVAAFGRPFFAGYKKSDASYQTFRQLASFLSVFQGTFTRSSGGTYFDDLGRLQSVGADAPRLQHKPYSRKNRGLLLESKSTNRIASSSDLSAWVQLNAVPVSTYSDSWAALNLTQPFAIKESIDSNGVEHSFSKSFSSLVNKRISGSFFFSVTGLSYVTSFVADAGRSNLFGVNLTISANGNVIKTNRIAGAGTLDFFEIERISTNIYRCRYAGTLNGSSISTTDDPLTAVFATTDSNANLVFASVGGLKPILVNEFQFESRDTPSNLIRTNSGPVSRDDETLSFLLDDFKFDPAEGTFEIEFFGRNLLAGTIIASFQNLDGTNRLELLVIAVDATAKTYVIGHRVVTNNVNGDVLNSTTVPQAKSFYTLTYADLPEDIRKAVLSTTTGFNGSILLISYT